MRASHNRWQQQRAVEIQRRTCAAAPSTPPERAWPYSVRSADLLITVHTPQVSSWSGTRFTARAAISIAAGDRPASYGTAQLTARALINRVTGLVTLEHYSVDFLVLQQAEERILATAGAALHSEASTRPKSIQVDLLLTTLQTLTASYPPILQPLANQPPQVIVSTRPAVLIEVDGPAVYRDVPHTRYRHIVNTRPVVLAREDGRHYLKWSGRWFTAANLSAEWAALQPAPSDLDAAFRRSIALKRLDARLLGPATRAGEDLERPADSTAPLIVLRSEPAELITIKNPLRWQTVPPTRLEFAADATRPLLKLQGEKKVYVLISGRWFSAATLQGPWKFVRADRLPPDFAQIPDESAVASVKVSVAGTQQARRAALANSIPQTAAISRRQARMKPPKFDGTPELAQIADTSLLYVVNSAIPIIAVKRNVYYAVEDGIWFASHSLWGPWNIASTIPMSIYGIPPSSPVYPVTSVRVYDSTPDTIYLGQWPGYWGDFVDPQSGVAVHGTGYDYRAWIGSAWYSPPTTYGPNADSYAPAVINPRLKETVHPGEWPADRIDDLFAGEHGDVFRYSHGMWEQYRPEGWVRDPRLSPQLERILEEDRGAREIASGRSERFARASDAHLSPTAEYH